MTSCKFYNQQLRKIYATPVVAWITAGMVFSFTVLVPAQLLFNLGMLQKFIFFRPINWCICYTNALVFGLLSV